MAGQNNFGRVGLHGYGRLLRDLVGGSRVSTMDELQQIEMWLARRDALEESAKYAAPEEQESIWREIRRAMRMVVHLMGRIKWVQGTPAA